MGVVDRMGQEYDRRSYRMGKSLGVGVKCSWCGMPIDWRDKNAVVVTYHEKQFQYCSLDHGAWGLGRMDTQEREEHEEAESH